MVTITPGERMYMRGCLQRPNCPPLQGIRTEYECGSCGYLCYTVDRNEANAHKCLIDVRP